MVKMIIIAASILVLSGCGAGTPGGPEVIFDDTYRLESTDNMEFAFSEDGTLIVRQDGIYELTENEEGRPLVRICLDDISRELPEDYNFTDYLVERKTWYIRLDYTAEGFDQEENPARLYLLEGEDGLRSDQLFDGVYRMGEHGDGYQYIFKKDGSISMRIEERYYADDTYITLSDDMGSTKYLYEKNGDMLALKNLDGDVILTLFKEEQ